MKHFYVVYNYSASDNSHGNGSLVISTQEVIFKFSDVVEIIMAFNKHFTAKDIVITNWKEITIEEHDVLYSV